MRRGLAEDREERYPDVPAFVAALTAALDGSFAGADEAPTAWIPPDPEPDPARPAAARVRGARRPRTSARSTRRRWATRRGRRPRGRPGRRLRPAAGTHRPSSSSSTRCRRSRSPCPERWTAAVDEERWVPPDATAEFPVALGRHGAGLERRRGARATASSWACCPATTCRPGCRSTPSAWTRPRSTVRDAGRRRRHDRARSPGARSPGVTTGSPWSGSSTRPPTSCCGCRCAPRTVAPPTGCWTRSSCSGCSRVRGRAAGRAAPPGAARCRSARATGTPGSRSRRRGGRGPGRSRGSAGRCRGPP